jgi:tRNA-dihydrouridine synthase A
MNRHAENPGESTQCAGKVGVSSVAKLSVAPMMEWTDRHCRYFLRGFSPAALLYTEMISAAAVTRGDAARLLAFDPQEHPVALQLGGSDPGELAAAARIGADFGYDQINLNCGCPSERVASGAFGACLMRQPQRVAECVAAMAAAVRIPVTVKMRIGVVSGARRAGAGALGPFEADDFAALQEFVALMHRAGSQAAIVHARMAVLGGLSPKENREVPPLRYDVVRRLKAAMPDIPIVLNGGLCTVPSALDALSWCEGVMLGREAYHRPLILAQLTQALTPQAVTPSREALLGRMADYAERQLAAGHSLPAITRHMLGLYAGEAGARAYRRLLSEGARAQGADARLIRRAGAAACTARGGAHEHSH